MRVTRAADSAESLPRRSLVVSLQPVPVIPSKGVETCKDPPAPSSVLAGFLSGSLSVTILVLGVNLSPPFMPRRRRVHAIPRLRRV